MLRSVLLFILLAGFPGLVQSLQEKNPSVNYPELGRALLASMRSDQEALVHFPFTDSLRFKWERLPGERRGLKISSFDENQKILMHTLMRNCLSTQGYLKVTSVMFNEDIQKKFEPTLGRNEFWFELFGSPTATDFWGWKLEGHHLSVNFTFQGNKVIAHTPFLVATNPAITKTDGERDGLMILYQEEVLGRELVNSFSEDQLKSGYTPRKKPATVYGEQDKSKINVPNEGIYFKQLNDTQQALLTVLVTEYINNFHTDEVPTVKKILTPEARFFFIGNREPGKEHYYRVENGKQLIEYENYDNHIHCFWRSANDFGKEIVR